MYPNPATIPRCFVIHFSCFILSCCVFLFSFFFLLLFCIYFLRAQLHSSSIHAFVGSSMKEKKTIAEKSNSLKILAIRQYRVPPCGCQYRIVVVVDGTTAAAADRMLIAISSNRFNWLYCEQLNLFIWALGKFALLWTLTTAMAKTIKFAFVFVDQFENIDNQIICLVDLRARASASDFIENPFWMRAARHRIFQINNEH